MSRVALIAFIFVRCAAGVTQEQPVVQSSQEQKVKVVTVEPKPFAVSSISKTETLDEGIYSLARNLIEIRTVSRRAADLRMGPGVEFNLQDWNLNQGESVVVLERSAKWLKVASFDGKKFGWIHKLALSDQKLLAKDQLLKNQNQNKFVMVDSKVFPTVFAATNVQRVYSYSKKEYINIEIPRGASFKMLREENGKKLLWFSQHGLLFWGDANEFL